MTFIWSELRPQDDKISLFIHHTNNIKFKWPYLLRYLWFSNIHTDKAIKKYCIVLSWFLGIWSRHGLSKADFRISTYFWRNSTIYVVFWVISKNEEIHFGGPVIFFWSRNSKIWSRNILSHMPERRNRWFKLLPMLSFSHIRCQEMASAQWENRVFGHFEPLQPPLTVSVGRFLVFLTKGDLL